MCTSKDLCLKPLQFVAVSVITLLATAGQASANIQKFLPEPLVYMDNVLSHHVIIAEKSTHKLHLYENNNSYPKLVKTFDMATGKKAGNKIFEGDHRTPEGVYTLESFIPNADLLKRYGKEGMIYGVGAFVLNYPNPVDRFQRKTGGGIWLHSTNDETRIDKGLDSRGCFVIKNNDLKNISTYIELNKTPLISVHDMRFLKEDAWLTNRIEIKNMITSWLESWRNEDITSYANNYHKEEFSDKFRGGYQKFKAYKRAVFSNPGAPQINISNLSVLLAKGYATVTFVQNYKSNTINDIGIKTLYLKKDKYYSWKIISENWKKVQNPSTFVTEFSPSMRFFNQVGDEKETIAQ